MKRSDIRKAYDSMNPTSAQKDKMLSAILEAETGRKMGKYQARPVKTNKWSWIPAVAALFAVVTAGIFVTGRTPQTENPVLDNPAIESAPAENTEIPVVYNEIIRACRTALEEDWDAATCQNSQISARFANTEYASENAGYQITDIDGNGTPELIIGHLEYIWNLYTLGAENTAVQLITDTNDGTVYQLAEGAHIIKELTTKDEGWHDCYLFEGTELVLETSIYGRDTDYQNLLTGESLTSKDALNLIDQYDRLDPMWVNFRDISDPLPVESEILELYLPIIEKYRTALTENWSWEQCDMADISRGIMYNSTNRSDLGWCLLDIDHSGMEELIISDGVQLFDLYALMPTDGLPGHILCSGEAGYSYSLCKDGTVERRINNGDFTYWSWFRLSETDYVEEQKLILDNTLHRYYLGVDQESSRTITENEAGEYLTSDEKATKKLNLMPFVELPETTVHEPNYYYEPIIELYRKAVVESWDPGKCVENGISLMIGYYGELYEEIGHNQIDLNGDGSAELIITDGTYIFDLYTVIHDEEDCAMRYTLDTTERNQYFMVQDNKLYCRGSGGAALSYYTILSVGERTLDVQEGFMYDAADNPDNPWFYYDGQTKGRPCNDVDAEAIVNSYKPDNIPFIPFGDGGLVLSSEESEWEAAKQKAFDIIKSGEEFGYAEYIAWLIPWRNQEFENPRPLYYDLQDANGDGIADLVLGYEDEVTAVWSYLFDEKAGEENLTLLNLSTQQWSELDESWPTWDIRPIENFLRTE